MTTAAASTAAPATRIPSARLRLDGSPLRQIPKSRQAVIQIVRVSFAANGDKPTQIAETIPHATPAASSRSAPSSLPPMRFDASSQTTTSATPTTIRGSG